MPRIDRREFLIASGATAGLSTLSASHLNAAQSATQVLGLKVDHLDSPMGLENPHPVFSWRLESDARNVRQTAFRILVAGSEAALANGRGDLWDSGRLDSAGSVGIVYAGRPLASRQRCWWSVRVWDGDSTAPSISDPSWWEMGLLEPDDWSAEWLAVESPRARADREFGLKWVWGENSDGTTSHLFRYKFDLPDASTAGEFFADVNHSRAKISGLWLDGLAITSPDERGLAGQRFSSADLDSGEHGIAVAVDTSGIRGARAGDDLGLTIFGRFDLRSGKTARFSSGSNITTGQTDSSNWYEPAFDDRTWKAAHQIDLGDYQPWPPQPAQDLRCEFEVKKPVVKARLYATALGAYEARLNGRRVGDALLTPEISQYDKRTLYRVYDVSTKTLRRGENVLGLTVGDGWYASWDGHYNWAPSPRRVLAQLELTLVDGTRQIITTGPGWRTTESPIRQAEMRMGEIYDARFEHPGWDSVGFDASAWQDAVATVAPACRIVAQTSPPIRAMETLKTQAITQPSKGVYVFDFGRNFSGWCRLHVKGIRGTRVELKFAEMLAPSGEIDQSSMAVEWWEEPKTDIYVLSGEKAGERFEPRFTYRGFRYVQVTGLPDAPTADTLEGIFAHSDLKCTGRIRSSEPLIEHIWRTTVQTQRSNFVAIPTDCPSREQRGWMGDVGIFWDAAAFNMDVCAFTSRQIDNVTDGQTDDGALPMCAPLPRRMYNDFFGTPGTAPAWGDGGIIAVWTAWKRYADREIVRSNWSALNRHLQFIQNNNTDYVWRHGRSADFGDWMSVGPTMLGADIEPTTPKELIGTAYWANSANLMSKMAASVGRSEDAAHYRLVFKNVRSAFNKAYVQDDGTVGNGSQTSHVLALALGLVDGQVKRRAEELLAKDVRERGVALTTGILGTQFILDVLTDAGFEDLAYGLLLRTEYPSWGYMFRKGATTIWENWTGEFQYVRGTDAFVSRNHFALGSVCGFLFRRMAGIDAKVPGFSEIVIRPVVDPRVTQGGGDYDSVMGRISTDWNKDATGTFTLDAKIPANTIATVYIPASRKSRITESRMDVAERCDMRIVSRLDDVAEIAIGSGSYRFVVDG
ncbi:MAG: glycoside hydrolase family 78 protein [Gammaproteobacteria bacterium]|nr:glycoside hydrolase family 78 protein [Gammaproteobacteria bacterium]